MTVPFADLSRRRPDTVAAAVVGLLPLVLTSPAWLTGRVLSPAGNLFMLYPWNAIAPESLARNPALTDITQVFHPALIYAGREVAAGRFPFWNPYAYAGAPFFSNVQTAMLFPLTALVYVLPAALALTLIAALKMSVAGLGMYWFLRASLAVTPAAALAGSLGFMFGSTLVSWLGWTLGTTVIVLPWLFGAIERLRATGARRYVAALALVIALDVLAGYPQGTAHAFLAAAAWALARAPGPGGAAFVARAAVAALLGLAATAVQVVPFIDYARESAVIAYRSQWTPALFVPWVALVTSLMPYFYGSGTEAWGPWQFNIDVVYVGLVLWLALPLAVAAAWHRTGTRFFTGLLLVCAAIHYGVPGIHALASTPGLSLGTNLRLMPLLAFVLCVLGALGLDSLARGAAGPWPGRVVRAWFAVSVAAGLGFVGVYHGERAAQAMTFTLVAQYLGCLGGLTVIAVTMLAYLHDPLRRPAWGVALAALQAASVLPLAATYTPIVDGHWLYPTPPALQHLQSKGDHGRVLMPGHVGLLYGLPEAHGYDGLTPRRVEQLVGSLGTGAAAIGGFLVNPVALHGSEPLSPAVVLVAPPPILDLFGVRWVVLPPGAAAPAPHFTLDYDGRDARVYRNAHALPRAFVAFAARCVDDGRAPALLRAGAVDPRSEVLLAECQTPPALGPRGIGVAEIVEYTAQRVRIVAQAEAPGLLVLTDTWFPGWRARVDGREAPLWRAHHAFRAVALPAGRHEVEFIFRPRFFAAAAAVSALALVVMAALAWPRRVRRA